MCSTLLYIGLIYLLVESIPTVLCDECPQDGCISCPHGPEACYQCTKEYKLINNNCLKTVDQYNYFVVYNSNGTIKEEDIVQYSEFCPEETHYIQVSDGDGSDMCRPCPDQCDGCYYNASKQAVKCWDCAYGYYMDQSQNYFEESDRYNQDTWDPVCKQTATKTSIDLQIQIKAAEDSTLPNFLTQPCTGKIVVDSFFKALIFVETVCSKSYSDGNITFLFDDKEHFIMIEKNYPDRVYEFFRSSNYVITIRSNLNGSKNSVKLYWRTEKIRIFSFNSLTVSDLTFDGSENKAYLNKDTPNAICFTTRALCCNHPVDSSKYKCDDNTSKRYFQDKEKNYVKWEPDGIGQGLFNILSSKRFNKDTYPQFTMNRIDIFNMMMDSPENNRYLLKISTNFGFVSFANVNVDKYYYSGGLISNFRYIQPKRGSIAYKDLDIGIQRRSDCRMMYPGILKNFVCLSIYIASCTFQNYNYLKYKRVINNFESDARLIESFTLNLYSTMVNLDIKSSKFLRAMVATTSTDDSKQQSKEFYVTSDVVQCKNNYSSSSESDILKSSFQKTDPNQHFDNDQISQNTRLLGSHIIWQYFKGKLSISDSTFDSNISYQSPALSISEYSQHMGAGIKQEYLFLNSKSEFTYVGNAFITLSKNTFSNNFAFVANSVLQFYSNRKQPFNDNYLSCQAMKFDSNTFQNNIGCPTSYFVVSINCRFKGMASDVTDANWYKELNPANTQKEGDDYLSQVMFKGNKFISNYAIYSNALFINGARDIYLQDNRFESNGVLISAASGEIQANNSPYMSMDGYSKLTYPYFDINNNWMTESTSLFIQHPVQIFMTGNTFQSNWAISSGDSYIGQSLMLHRVISVTDIKLYNNVYSSHVGVPERFLKSDQLQKSYSTMPIVSIHFYTNNKLKKTITQPIQIDFYTNTFENNIYKIDVDNKDTKNLKMDSYTLYSLGGNVQLIKLFTDNEIKGSQPVSTDYLNMMYQKVNFLVRNSNFTANKHQNGGCMVEVSGMNLLQFQGNGFNGNENDNSSFQIGAKVCLLNSSPITLANLADKEPKLNFLVSEVNNEKGAFLYDDLANSNQQVGDIDFVNCESSSSIIISKDTTFINMEGNSFTQSKAIKGLISVTRASSIILKDLTVQKSLPYSIYVESVYDFQISGLNIDNNDARLFPEYVKSIIKDDAKYTKFIKQEISVIFLYRSRGQMLDCKFTNNIAASGIVSFLRDNSVLKASNLVVQNNYATNVGGGIYVSDESVVNLSQSQFYNNTSEQNGGCFFIQNSYFGIKLSNMTKCISQMNSGVARIEQSNVEIETTLFSMNQAIKEASIFHSIRSTVSVLSSEFFDNTASACSIIASDVKLTISKSNFTGNEANFKSKNIYATQSTLLVDNSYFLDDKQANSTAGSFIQLFKSDGIIKTSQFISGLSNFGGAIMIESFSDVEINQCNFKNNYAVQSGGAIASSSYLNVIASNFTQNSAQINGNDIYFKCQDDLVMRDVIIEASLGKSIYVWGRRFQTFNLNITGIPALKKKDLDESKGIFSFQTQTVEINDSLFQNLFATKGAGIHIVNEINVQTLQTLITNTKFVRNRAQRAGGLYVDGLTNTNIVDSYFQFNQAYYFNDTIGTGNGAGIYYSCPLEFALCKFQITRSSFISNQAEMDGGAIKFDASEVNVDYQTQFANNYAIYGPDIASYPIHLFKTDSTDKDQISEFKSPEAFEEGFKKLVSDSYQFEDQVSGKEMNLIYALTDHYGSVVKTANSSQARFTANQKDDIFLEGGLKISVNGFFDFSDFIVTINPGDYLNLLISTDAVPEGWMQKARIIQQQASRMLQSTTSESKLPKGSVPVNLQFRKCKLGEIQENKKCKPCKNHLYSNQVEVSEGSSQCKECKENSVCYGKNEVAPNSGFWRLDEISENFIACPNSVSCTGGYDGETLISYTGDCAKGYQGNLCMQCASGWARYGDSECVECQNNLFYDLRAVITCIITFTMISLGIKKQLETGGSEKQHTISLLKIFGNFSQTISIISLFALQWPSSVDTVTSINNQYLSAPLQVFSMDCYFTNFGVSTSLVRVFITIVTPLIIMLSSIFFFCIFYSIKEGIKLFTDKQNLEKLKNAIIITQLVIIFVFHPEIVTASFSLFQCQNLGDDLHPAYYSQLELQLKCFEGEHLLWIKYLGTPSLIVWVFIIPFIMALTLWKYKDIIDRPDIVATYGFITKGYRAEYFYWEIITMYRKSILVIGSIFMKIDPFLSGLNILLYLFFWLMVQQRFQPLLTHQLNQVEEYSLLTQVFYIYFSLYFLVNEKDSFVTIIMITLLMVTYAGYHLYFLLVYIRQKIIEFTETITNVSQEVKHPFLVKVFDRLANVKALACLKTWLIEQKTLVENAIINQNNKLNEKLDKEIENNQNSKVIKEEIKDAINETQIKKISQQDEFLMIKKRNKEMSQVAQRFANILQKKQEPKVNINAQLKKMAKKVKNKQEDSEEVKPLKGDFENQITLHNTETQQSDDEENHNF